MHLLPALLPLSQLSVLVWATHHGHHGHHHDRRQASSYVSPALDASATVSAFVPTESSEAAEMVARALEVLRVVNKLRLENVQYNSYEFKNSSAVQPSKESAAPLDYSESAVKALDSLQKRDSAQPANTSSTYSYSIPADLREAARIMAEASPPSPSTGNHDALAAQVRAKYGVKQNDSLIPTQVLRRPNGLLEYAQFEPEYRGNSTDGSLGKRSFSAWWMATMQQRGANPYAPNDYKVWRNVMDYGAKGDGLTDDTAAINLAISDGNRCGASCGSSTIYPAVVYFPPGTYLVSSSVIQYYNTQLIGDPLELPTIMAASSFVGLGVITSNVYVGDQEEWYINTNNFLRSIRNFKLDITRTAQDAYVCAIHWQVAQGTSLENIYFYMSQDPATTQQGLYMENGSGGFMSDLTFVGGNFGAYLGNQQFTTSHMVFVNCKTALQIHWDWAWTMQDVVIESCTTGIVIIGGAGGPFSTGQGVGSFVLVDAVIANTPTGIITTLYSKNSTALLLQNVGFYNTQNAIFDDNVKQALVSGGDATVLDSWGFGMVNDPSGTRFVSGENLPVMNRTQSLVGSNVYNIKPNFFTRRRPQYHDLGSTQVLDVKALGAKGDGITDDTTALNSILARGANMSSIIFFPHGVYVIKNTLKIPKGSRILGQAWSQIMATGPQFEDIDHPSVAVQVGDPGDVGIVEIQDMLFTVSGPTAGAVLMEWNIHESTQGSAGLWDSHFRVGGAIGSNLQAVNCPKGTGTVKKDCIAASLMLHLTRSSSAYLENVWVWTADHDLDLVSQDQLDVYTARGVLVESQGPTWLYGTASEHSVLYQYQLHQAKDVLLGMIQTESPYFQPIPPAPEPFRIGLFASDPDFGNCTVGSPTCALSWAVRIVDSSSVLLLGAGLYSWFSDYSQTCLDTDNCQDRGFHIEESYDIWIYNLVTKAIKEMVSPSSDTPTYARDNKNGYMSSLLAWVRGPKAIIGGRNFPGFYVWDLDADADALEGLPSSCRTALAEVIQCDRYVQTFLRQEYRQSLHNDTLTASVCDSACGESLKGWFDNVASTCSGHNVSSSAPTKFGGQIWAGWNETCLQDRVTRQYCNDVIAEFDAVSTEALPHDQLCSFCFVERLEMMQRSPYSVYDEYFQADLQVVHEKCGLKGPTDMPPSLDAVPELDPDPICVSGNTYTTTSAGETCDSIALKSNVSSAALFMANPAVSVVCGNIAANLALCLPFPCETTYVLKANDTCTSIELANNYRLGDVRRYNSWVSWDCSNLQKSVELYGSVLCLGPQGGTYSSTAPIAKATVSPVESTGYLQSIVPPPSNVTVANGTTLRCGKWHVAVDGDSCPSICIQESITADLFLEVNPSLSSGLNCTGSLVRGSAYCVGPNPGWKTPLPPPTALPLPDESESSSPIPSSSTRPTR